MRSRDADRLDAFARLLTRDRAVKRSNESVAEEEAQPADLVTRGTAIGLALAGAASLSLGLWRAPESGAASAFTYRECINQCVDNASDANLIEIKACESAYGGENLWRSNTGWSRFKSLVKVGVWKWILDTSRLDHKQGCIRGADQRFLNRLDKCDEACKVACPETRSPQGVSTRLQACKPPPPPKPESPKPPPAPNHTESACWACVQAGGECCGPFTGDPAVGLTPCACANPAVGCQAYGC